MGKSYSSARQVTIFALLIAIAALLQISAGFFPGIGHFLSVFCTVPIAIAAALSPGRGLLAYIGAAIIIFIIQPIEMPIFVLTTGPFGWVLGWAYHGKKRRNEQVLWSSIVLFVGMLVLTFLVNMPALGDFVWGPTGVIVITYAIFAVLYAILWQVIMPHLWRRLESFL